MFKGLKRDTCLDIVGLTKNQYYYVPTGNKPGKRPTKWTRYRDPVTLEEKLVDENHIVTKVVELKTNPDQAKWYRLITFSLQMLGYFINHKKVFRIMTNFLLLEERPSLGTKDYVQFRRVTPINPLEVIEMDIKYVWISGLRRYAFVLTVIDTFTRYVLNYRVGLSMKTAQVKQCWEAIIATYFQPNGFNNREVHVEVRTDNGKQFSSRDILAFFEANKVDKVFTHPYTPEENAHVESFNKTLGNALKNNTFNTLKELETRLDKFYTCYNNERSHSATKGIPPAKFWTLLEQNKIKVIPLPKHRIRFEVGIKYQDILLQENINKYDYRAI